ncbi:hypothetical protein [Veillonella sp.]|uniref:hypothetical protein n=1 Tax=Veillonella sp. TaxID=1926307 RepID=UPI002903119F|nr:hypothetical protein [Veillonella sp.]MDU2334335.1 hypothetical protein [Veillonella sp.]MDU2347491.1 hypothetical protein [Veillonella sp.]
MSTNRFKNTTYPSPTLFDGLQNASKEELSYLIALLRQQTMMNIFSDKFNSTVTTGKKAINSVMSFFGKSKKTNEEIERQDKDKHQDINDKIKEEIHVLQNYTQEQLYNLFIEEVRNELDIPDSSLTHLSNKIIESAAKTDKTIHEDLDINQKADIIYQKTLQSIKTSLEKQSVQERDEMIRQLNEELDNLSSDRKELIKQSLQTDHLSGEVLRNSFLKSGVGIGSLITVGSTFGAYIAINTIIHAIFTSFLGITLPFAVYTGVAKGVSIIAGPIGWCALGGYSVYSLIKTSGKLTSAMMSVIVFIAMTIYGKSFLLDDNGAPLWFTSDSAEYQEYKNNQYRIRQLHDELNEVTQNLARARKKAEEIEAAKQAIEKELKQEKANANSNNQTTIDNLNKKLEETYQQLSSALGDCEEYEKIYKEQTNEIDTLNKRNKKLEKENIVLHKETQYLKDYKDLLETDNEKLNQSMIEKENKYVQEIQELKEAMVEDEYAYDNDKNRLNEGKILQRKFEDFELEKQFLQDYTSASKSVRDDIDRMLIRLYKIDDPTQIDATHNSKIDVLGYPVYHMQTAKDYRLYYTYSKTSAKPIHILCHCIKAKQDIYFKKLKNSETLKQKFR